MASLLNRHQPIRPRHLPDGSPLYYRTRPIIQTNILKMSNPNARIVQLRLYRAVRKRQFVNHAPIEETYRWLFHDVPSVTKHILGKVILNCTIYEARKLVNRNGIKPVVIYSFNNLLDLEYGLEWQICSWLRTFLNETAAPGEQMVDGPDMMSDELDIIVNMDDYQMFEDEVVAFKFSEPAWADLCRGLPQERMMVADPVRPKSVYD